MKLGFIGAYVLALLGAAVPSQAATAVGPADLPAGALAAPPAIAAPGLNDWAPNCRVMAPANVKACLAQLDIRRFRTSGDTPDFVYIVAVAVGDQRVAEVEVIAGRAAIPTQVIFRVDKQVPVPTECANGECYVRGPAIEDFARALASGHTLLVVMSSANGPWTAEIPIESFAAVRDWFATQLPPPARIPG